MVLNLAARCGGFQTTLSGCRLRIATFPSTGSVKHQFCQSSPNCRRRLRWVRQVGDLATALGLRVGAEISWNLTIMYKGNRRFSQKIFQVLWFYPPWTFQKYLEVQNSDVDSQYLSCCVSPRQWHPEWHSQRNRRSFCRIQCPGGTRSFGYLAGEGNVVFNWAFSQVELTISIAFDLSDRLLGSGCSPKKLPNIENPFRDDVYRLCVSTTLLMQDVHIELEMEDLAHGQMAMKWLCFIWIFFQYEIDFLRSNLQACVILCLLADQSWNTS